MDVTPFLDLRIAPRAVFDSLPERAERPRFMVRGESGAWEAVTWQSFADDIRHLGLWLEHTGVAPGDRVAILAHNRVEWMVAALAIQAVGGVMVPVYPSCTAEQVAYVVTHSDATLVVAEPALAARVPSGPRLLEYGAPYAAALSLGASIAREHPGAFERRMDAVELDQAALMLYTSGTSGPPKGVPLTHRNVGVNGRDWLECLAPILHEDAVDLLWLPMSHIFGFGEACLGNTLGFLTWMSSPLEVLSDLPAVRPTVFMSVPSVWEKLAAAADLDAVTGGRLRFCLSGGAGRSRQVKERFGVGGALVIEGYGLTEASPTLTLNRPGDFRFDSVGKPLPSVELRLADDGEILARGQNVFAGYHKDPEATAAALTEDGWLRTGDLGRFTEDGFLQIVDRKKDILVTAGGKNVAPANIELRFRDDPVIEHLVVFGDGRKYLVAGVWLRPGADPAAVEGRIAAVNADLARFESIKRFAIIDAPLTVENGLLTPTLKVKRKAVTARFLSAFEALYG